MVELGIENKTKRATLDETMTRSVKVVAGTCNRHYLLFRAEGLPVVDVAYGKVKSPFPTRFLS